MTHQLHENISYEGKDLSMMSLPHVPLDQPRIIALSDEEIFAINKKGRMVSSSCWRGYVGSWEIKDGRLYLTKLERDLMLEGTEPLFADWVSEELHIVFEYAFEGLRAGLRQGDKTKKVTIKNGTIVNI